MLSKNLVVASIALLGAACSSDSTEPTIGDQPDAVSDVGVPNATAGDLGATGDAAEVDMSAADLPTTDTTPIRDADSPAQGWQTLAPLPAAQQEVAVVALDGLIYVIGGFTAGGAQVATNAVYDPASNSWSSRADFPTPANHMNATVVDGQIWVTGFLSMGFSPDARTFVYDPPTDAWSPGPDLPDGRGRGSSAVGVVDGQIYVAGGIGSGGARAWTDVLDPVTGVWTPRADAPREFDHAGFGVIDGQLIVAAGRFGTITSFVDEVHVYDPASDTWSDRAPIPTARGGVASAVLDGVLYVFGGEGAPDAPGQVFDEVEAYDFANDAWTVLQPMPSPRHGLAGIALDGVIYLPGGADRQFLAAVATVESFVP